MMVTKKTKTIKELEVQVVHQDAVIDLMWDLLCEVEMSEWEAVFQDIVVQIHRQKSIEKKLIREYRKKYNV